MMPAPPARRAAGAARNQRRLLPKLRLMPAIQPKQLRSAEDSEADTQATIAAAADDGESVSEPVSAGEADADEDSEPVAAETEDAGKVEQEASNVEEVEAADPASAGDEGQDEEDQDDDENDDDGDDDADDENGEIESVGSDDALEEVTQRKVRHQRAYKIQEVIKRRQVILVQVVKEERGTKGAALTTYLSLAGRYCVLMPNTARGGGISRKITNPADRRRLKEVAGGLDVPEGMGLIVRTAGANRTKAEVKRDFEYLLRLWENVRDLTLESSAPSLVYEEGSLIKRSIRDLYNKDVDTVLVEGEEAYREAKDFMRMLMPSHAKNVQAYKDPQPIFIRNQVEPQLDALFSSHCGLKSGGYLVINQTEALVAVDVNSGKSTKEHNIEDTALRTNLEAAEEVARQLRLRDLAGLIVIDFIDMEEKRNNRAVERRLKDKLKDDRARIQVGRISHFGLLEMSRQRMRSGMLEGSTLPCENCQGRGFVRSVESASLHILRGIEDHAITGKSDNLLVRAPAEMVLYIFNQKRDHLLSIEQRYDISIFLETDETLVNSEFAIANASDRPARRKAATPVVQIDSAFASARDGGADGGDRNADGDIEADGEEGARPKRRRRRRGRRRGRDSEAVAQSESGEQDAGEISDTGDDVAASADGEERTGASEESERPKRRRGKRGGRRHRKKADAQAEAASEATDDAGVGDQDDAAGEPADVDGATETAAESPAAADKSSDDAVAESAESGDTEKAEAPKRGRRRKTTAQLVAEISGQRRGSSVDARRATMPRSSEAPQATDSDTAASATRKRRTLKPRCPKRLRKSAAPGAARQRLKPLKPLLKKRRKKLSPLRRSHRLRTRTTAPQMRRSLSQLRRRWRSLPLPNTPQVAVSEPLVAEADAASQTQNLRVSRGQAGGGGGGKPATEFSQCLRLPSASGGTAAPHYFRNPLSRSQARRMSFRVPANDSLMNRWPWTGSKSAPGVTATPVSLSIFWAKAKLSLVNLLTSA